MRTKPLTSAAQLLVNAGLAKTNWNALPEVERLTKYRAAKEAITQRILADLATEQARREAEQAREASDWLARWTAGGRHGH